MKKAISIVVIVVAIVGAAFILKGNKEEMEAKTQLAKEVNATIPVQVVDVVKETLGGTFTATGNFNPDQELTIVSEGSGKIISVLVDEGAQVKKGQVLARLEYNTKAAELQAAEASYKKLETDKQRYENLLKSGGVSQSQLDDINLNFTSAEARLITARKNVDDTYIRAPFDGVINKRYIEVGSYLSQQSNKAFDLVDLSHLKLTVNVTESQVLAVTDAEDIAVTADVYPGVEYDAKVNFIGAKADANLNYPVELEITNVKNKPLRAGMYGRATFKLDAGAPALTIPRDALVGSVNKAQVYAVTDGKAVLKDVVIGRQFSDKVEVLEGLTEGQQVVTRGQINLSSGTAVTVLK